MISDPKQIVIVGGGLVGCLASVYMRRRGFKVKVYERNPDPRSRKTSTRPSLGITLCERGLRALTEAGAMDAICRILTPAYGRTIHRSDGSTIFQPYGTSQQAIYSVSRRNLNIALVGEAIRAGATVNFDCQCIDLDQEKAEIMIIHKGRRLRESGALIVAADGSNSIVRAILTKRRILRSSQTRWKNGYKELQLAALSKGSSSLGANTLHLWPRQSHMAIAFPNRDGSFTCAVHMPFEGALSFESLRLKTDAIALFRESFPDLVESLSTLTANFLSQRPNAMETVNCEPWSVGGKVLLIGDAAHAVLPSYGQGANAGFEDCRLLDEALDRFGPDWKAVCDDFEQLRRPDTDVLAELCTYHFVELCDLVADDSFQLRRRIERRIHEMFPDRFSSLYSMITFSSLPYSQAQMVDRQQSAIIDKLTQIPNIEDALEREQFHRIVNQMLPQGPATTSTSAGRLGRSATSSVFPT